MAVNLKKGGRVDLTKAASDIGITKLNTVFVGLGWDVVSYGASADLDVWALALNSKSKTQSRSLFSRGESPTLVYFGNKVAFGGKIKHMGDNLTGAGDGDDETIAMDLAHMPDNIDTILIGVTIYRAIEKRQNFGMVDNAFIRICSVDNTGVHEICRYADQFKDSLAQHYTMLFGALTRDESNNWIFNALGEPSEISSIRQASSIYKNFNLNAKEKIFMPVNLSKGGKVSLAKAAADAGIASLKKVGVGLGWDTNKYDGGFDFDLDASAFLTGSTGKVLRDSDFVFYNNADAPGVHHTGDNRTGAGDGDDETIEVTLDAIDPNVEKISFTVTIDQADVRQQNFGMVENAYIRVYDLDSGTELIRYDLTEDFSVQTALIVGELYKHDGAWKFNAKGEGFADGLAGLCRNFGVNI